MPHLFVLHPHKLGKVRRVLNGAAKFLGHSLKASVLTGPDVIQSLRHVFQHFRQPQYPVSADIERMILEVGIIPTDPPSFRFFCRKDPATNVAVFQYTRHIFGAKDYALQRTASDNATKHPEAARSVQENFYTDDYLGPTGTIQRAKEKAQNLIRLLGLGGFNLRKLVSNVPEVEVDLNRNTENKDVKVIASDTETSHVLGLKWNHQSRTLVVSRRTSPQQKSLTTQRAEVNLMSTVFGPIRLVAPYTVKARLLLKDIWLISGQKWDHEFPEDISHQLVEWSKDLPSLSSIIIPRSYFKHEVHRLELDVFGDSSKTVFSAVTFPVEKLLLTEPSFQKKLL